LEDIQRIVAAKSARFTLRQQPGAAAEDAASFQIQLHTNRESLNPQAPVVVGKLETLTPESKDLPEFVVYETSYTRYPLVLSAGGIRSAAGMQYTPFTSVRVAEDGSMPVIEAEVGIWIELRSAMKAESSVSWQRTESGLIITADEIPKTLWNKAVARRADIGILFEDGQVRKEVPSALRGKGGKGKSRKGKGSLKARAEDESGSASEE
jgi:2'-phosphotransferase